MMSPRHLSKSQLSLAGACLVIALSACVATPEALPLPNPTAIQTIPPSAPITQLTLTPPPTITAKSPDRCAAPSFSHSSAIRSDTVSKLKIIATAQRPLVRALAFSPDDAQLAAASGDVDGNMAGVTTMCSGNAEVQSEFAQPGAAVWDVAYSLDGRYLAYASSCSHKACVVVRDAAAGHVLQTLAGGDIAYALAFSPDSALLAFAGAPEEITYLFSTADWTSRGALNPHEYVAYDLAFFPSGDRLAVAGIHGEVHFWNALTKIMLGLVYQTDPAYRVSISPDGRRMAAVYCSTKTPWLCSNGRIMVWDTAQGSQIIQLERQAQAAAFSPDGSLLAVGSGAGAAHLRLYETATWKIIFDTSGETDQLAFSPDGRFLATADGRTIHIWAIE